jgi:hypothetical protein
MKRILLVGALSLAGLSLGSSARAEDPREPGVIDLGELMVEGKISKPQVFYVLGRAEFRYEGLKLKNSFLERIVDTARKNPF